MAKLKIQGEQFESLMVAIEKTIKYMDDSALHWYSMTAAEWYRSQNRSHMRFRWDVLLASRYSTKELYAAGCDDNHIDSALKAIIGRDY